MQVACVCRALHRGALEAAPAGCVPKRLAVRVAVTRRRRRGRGGGIRAAADTALVARVLSRARGLEPTQLLGYHKFEVHTERLGLARSATGADIARVHTADVVIERALRSMQGHRTRSRLMPRCRCSAEHEARQSGTEGAHRLRRKCEAGRVHVDPPLAT